MKNKYIVNINAKLEEIQKFKEEEDYVYFKGFLAGLFDAGKLNLQEVQSYENKAKELMGYPIYENSEQYVRECKDIIR